MKVEFVHRSEPQLLDGDSLTLDHMIYVELEGGCGFSYHEGKGGPAPVIGEDVWVVDGEFGKTDRLTVMWTTRSEVLVLIP